MTPDPLPLRKISFVIPALNEENYIHDCIVSIRSQNIRLPYEIIVVDNNSKDRTALIAKKLDVQVVSETNVGLPYARQKGLAVAKGDLLIYLDADTRLTKGCVNKILDRFEENPKLVGLTPGGTYYDGGFAANFFILLLQIVVWPIIKRLHDLFRFPQPLIGHLIAMRTLAMRAAGGINLDYRFYGEDAAIAQRLATQGDLMLDPRIKVLTSWRRFRKLGFFHTAKNYIYTYILILMGKNEEAKKFSETSAHEADISKLV